MHSTDVYEEVVQEPLDDWVLYLYSGEYLWDDINPSDNFDLLITFFELIGYFFLGPILEDE